MNHRQRRLVLAIVCALLIVAAFSAPVSAHAYLEGANPDEGAQIDDLPEELSLEFTGDGVELASVTVEGPDGSDVSGDAEIDPDDRQLVTAPLEDAGDGMYVVEWEVLADDGHTTSGTFFFLVGEGDLDRDTLLTIGEESDDDRASVLEAGANGLILLSLVALVGVPVTMWVGIYPVLGRAEHAAAGSADERASTLLAGAGGLLLVGVVLLGIARFRSITGDWSLASLGGFLETGLGMLWIGQLVVAGALFAGLVAVNRGWHLERRPAWLGASVLGGLAVQFSVGWTSHSASLVSRLEGLAVDVTHIGGAALWLGGLVVLAVVLPAVLRASPVAERRRLAAEAIGRFSVIALTGVTLALVTGLLLAAWHVPDLEALRETAYGTLLSAKTALVMVALGLGGFTRYVLLRRLRPASDADDSPASSGLSGRAVREDGGSEQPPNDGADDGGLRTVIRGIRLEVAVLIVVILLSGLITATPTSTLAADDDGNHRAEVEVTDGDLELAITVLPGFDSFNNAYVEEGDPVVFDVVFLQDGDPVSASDVQLFMRNEAHDTTLTVDLEETDDGAYSTVQTMPDPEHWDVRITAWVEDEQVSEWIEVYAIPADHDHGDHDDHDHAAVADGPLAALLQLVAVGVALVGSVAVVFETSRAREW